jgi:hypothetical protein
MSKMKQYFMYGILVQQSWYKEWEKQSGREFELVLAALDSSDDNVDDISCYFDTRDGKFLIIGKKFDPINDGSPIQVDELSDMQKWEIEYSVKLNFDLVGDFHYYFIKNYK